MDTLLSDLLGQEAMSARDPIRRLGLFHRLLQVVTNLENEFVWVSSCAGPDVFGANILLLQIARGSTIEEGDAGWLELALRLNRKLEDGRDPLGYIDEVVQLKVWFTQLAAREELEPGVVQSLQWSDNAILKDHLDNMEFACGLYTQKIQLVFNYEANKEIIKFLVREYHPGKHLQQFDIFGSRQGVSFPERIVGVLEAKQYDEFRELVQLLLEVGWVPDALLNALRIAESHHSMIPEQHECARECLVHLEQSRKGFDQDIDLMGNVGFPEVNFDDENVHFFTLAEEVEAQMGPEFKMQTQT